MPPAAVEVVFRFTSFAKIVKKLHISLRFGLWSHRWSVNSIKVLGTKASLFGSHGLRGTMGSVCQ